MEGFDVITAKDGMIALQLLSAITPDLILTNLALPKIYGTDFIELTRRMQTLAFVPIIVLSAYENIYLLESHRAGTTIVMRKPHDVPRLVETIQRLLAA
jgi:CheY-like chemotaxis protein